jgi:predicted ATPase
MTDQRNQLQKMFEVENRYANFGEVLVSLGVEGFRCHTSTRIDIDNPITAFCGLNGTGKSTLLQLAAVAYNKAMTGRVPSLKYYVKDFIVSGTLDPTPFHPNAAITYRYWQDDRKTKRVIVTRSAPEKRWRGYKGQPRRSVYFAGMGLYLPKVEIRDFIVRNATKLKINTSAPVPEKSKEWICKILDWNYDSVVANSVTHAHKRSDVVTVSRMGNSYSEANMGCGEGRVQHTIRVLETLPEKSLICLEEPETSLHPSAQHEFGKYLIDVCIRKRHQLILTTHSEYLLSSLPSASRIYLDRSTGQLLPIKGITTAQAKSLMAGGHDTALHILVEDDVAQAVLTEILRKTKPLLLKTVKIHSIGSAETISSVIRALKSANLPIAAVRDGDQGVNARENLFKLPGSEPPEKELLKSESVKQLLKNDYGVDLEDFRASVIGINHHEWFSKLAERTLLPKAALIQIVAREYVKGLSEGEMDAIANPLQESIRK